MFTIFGGPALPSQKRIFTVPVWTIVFFLNVNTIFDNNLINEQPYTHNKTYNKVVFSKKHSQHVVFSILMKNEIRQIL